MVADPKSEASKILEILSKHIPFRWDGKNAILELKEANYQWRQMEWIGWYFEFKTRKTLLSFLGGKLGPRYGSTHFDYLLQNVWDFKVHVKNSPSHPWTIINDRQAVDLCIKDYDVLCILLAIGEAESDDRLGSFKTWHDQLKGGKSNYEIDRINRGAPSRKRKSAFKVESLEAIFPNSSSIKQGLNIRWIRYFQEGMRNANGSPRRPKYMLNLANLPDHIRLN